MLKQLVLISLLWVFVDSSLFDAHIFPSQGPFFEGWYIKTFDPVRNFSIANIIAKHLSNSNRNSGYLGFLLADSLSQPQEPMKTFDFFTEGFNFLDCIGSPLTMDPDLSSPPCLQVLPISNDNSVQGGLKTNGDAIEIEWKIRTQSVQLDYRLKLTNHTLWSGSGLGPQGITSLIPKLGLYWFVFSVSSSAEYSLTVNGLHFEGKGFSHIEKNWGDSFPDSWMWAEGMRVNEDGSSVEFALAGGPKQLGPLPISPILYLVGYRSKKVQWSFHPQDLVNIFEANHDSCNGEMNMTVKGPTAKLEIQIKADVRSFKNCLFGPSKEGMKPMCLESFSAVAKIRAYSADLGIGGIVGAYHLVEEVEIPMSALEFGGEYLAPCFSCGTNAQFLRKE